MKIKMIAIGVVSLLLLSSCATIFAGKKNTVKIIGGPVKSHVFLDGDSIGITPLNIRIDKYKLQEGSIIEVKKKGYQTYIHNVVRRPHVGYVMLDIFSGAIPLIVDVANGNIYRPNTRKIQFDLQYDTLGAIEKKGTTKMIELKK
jgi:hypothetical protein